jgi:alpha-beta hydrolase superfamily lysophospholipase
MGADKPVVVLVHGAYHQTEHFNTLVKSLKAKGFGTEAPALPSVGATTGSNGAMSRDADVVAQTLQKVLESGRDAIVFMHSMGGVVRSSSIAPIKFEPRSC